MRLVSRPLQITNQVVRDRDAKVVFNSYKMQSLVNCCIIRGIRHECFLTSALPVLPLCIVEIDRTVWPTVNVSLSTRMRFDSSSLCLCHTLRNNAIRNAFLRRLTSQKRSSSDCNSFQTSAICRSVFKTHGHVASDRSSGWMTVHRFKSSYSQLYLNISQVK